MGDNYNDEKRSDEKTLSEWQGRRSKTFIGFLCQAVALGMEYSLTFITLWLYLTEMVHTTHPKLYYSAVSASYLLSQVRKRRYYTAILTNYTSF